MVAAAPGEALVEGAGAEVEALAGVRSSSFLQRSWMPSWMLITQEWTPAKETSRSSSGAGPRCLLRAPWREGAVDWGLCSQ